MTAATTLTAHPKLERIGMVRHLSTLDWDKLEPLFHTVENYDAQSVINHRGDLLNHSLLLIDGVTARSIPRQDSQRSTFVALQFKGDFVDLHAFPLKRLDHDVVAVTHTQVAVIEHAALEDLLNNDIALSRDLWSLTLVDASIHRHWAMRNSVMRGFARVANFFCEIDARLSAATGKQQDDYLIGISQLDIADATGMTPVHVSRVLRDLREDGCCTIAHGRLRILNREKLQQRGMFDPAYLYLPNSDAQL